MTSPDQDAMRVATRYAALIEKAETLTGRARACEAAAHQYRRDARANQESAADHTTAARTIRDPHLARQHARAARDAEAEAAREILAARYYEQQAETYQAEARGVAPSGSAGRVLDGRTEATGNYDGPRERPAPGSATGKEAMTTASSGATGPADTGALPDTAGLTNGEHWHGSDAVTAASGDGTVSVGRCQYPGSDAYVVVATTPADTPWDPDSGVNPALNKQEAAKLADTLDELAGLAESGTPTTPPTRLEKLAARVRDLIGPTGVTIAGEEGEIEISAADMRTILDAAAPEPAVPTRRKIDAKACLKDNMDTGAVWAQVDTSGPQPAVAVTSTEGEPPEDYPQGYTTTRLAPAEAHQLAVTVRRFARIETPESGPPGEQAPIPVTAPASTVPSGPPSDAVGIARHVTAMVGDGDHDGAALYLEGLGRDRLRAVAEAAGVDQARAPRAKTDQLVGGILHRAQQIAHPTSQPRRVTNSRGLVYEYDPADGSTAVIEPDGWRAVVTPTSPPGAAARLLWWNAEIKDGRGSDATEEDARALLGRLNAAELRQVAEEIGMSAQSGRTKPQLVDGIVSLTIMSARKARALFRG